MQVDPTTVGGAVAIALAALVAALRLELFSRVAACWERQKAKSRTAHEAHSAIPEALDALERIERKTDRNGFLIQHFHEDEEVSIPVDEVDDEFFRGGSDGP